MNTRQIIILSVFGVLWWIVHAVLNTKEKTHPIVSALHVLGLVAAIWFLFHLLIIFIYILPFILLGKVLLPFFEKLLTEHWDTHYEKYYKLKLVFIKQFNAVKKEIAPIFALIVLTVLFVQLSENLSFLRALGFTVLFFVIGILVCYLTFNFLKRTSQISVINFYNMASCAALVGFFIVKSFYPNLISNTRFDLILNNALNETQTGFTDNSKDKLYLDYINKLSEEIAKKNAEAAMIKWTMFKYASDGSTYYLASTKQIQKGSTIVTLWQFVNLAKPMGNALSLRVQRAYDCASYKSKVLFYSQFAEHDLVNELTESESGLNLEWEQIVPGSMNENIYKVACQQY